MLSRFTAVNVVPTPLAMQSNDDALNFAKCPTLAATVSKAGSKVLP